MFFRSGVESSARARGLSARGIPNLTTKVTTNGPDNFE